MKDITIQPPAILNGIDTLRQKHSMGALRSDLDRGAVRFQAVNCWEGGTKTRSRITAFEAADMRFSHSERFTVETDLPGAFLGDDRAPTPTEHALHSLAACMTTTMVYICTARGIEVRSAEAEVQGEMNAAGFTQVDDSVRRGFSCIRLRFNIDADAPDGEIQQMLEESPLFDVFTNGVPLTVEMLDD